MVKECLWFEGNPSFHYVSLESSVLAGKDCFSRFEQICRKKRAIQRTKYLIMEWIVPTFEYVERYTYIPLLFSHI